jgi:hypothetical protein
MNPFVVQEFLDKLNVHVPSVNTSSKASAFDAIINNQDTGAIIKKVLDLSNETSTVEEKVKYDIYVLNLSKEDHMMFLATCFYVMRDIGLLKTEEEMVEAFRAIFAAGQSDFEKIVMATKSAHKKYLRTQKPVKVPKTPNDFNVWIYPQSSSIASYMYNADQETLHIRFKSGLKIYPYYGISKTLFRDLQNAESKGTFFAEHIKPASEIKTI